jgi:hypothetical protein
MLRTEGDDAAVVDDEVMQFRDAVLVGPGTYQLSGFLQGRLGTDDRIATHAADERFVLLSGAIGLKRGRDGLTLRGLSRS